MAAVKISSKEPLVYSIFGLQNHEIEDNSAKQALRDEFDALISPHAAYLDRFVQDGCATRNRGTTFVWLKLLEIAIRLSQLVDYREGYIQTSGKICPPPQGCGGKS